MSTREGSTELYAAEDAAAREAGVRRFARFSELESYVHGVVLGDWWSSEFPVAPLEVEVSRRSRSATWSAAAIDADGVGLLAFVDGAGWGLETVLHELAHLAAGPGTGHGRAFRSALGSLWRHEAGVQAWACLQGALSSCASQPSRPAPGGLPVDGPRDGFPRPVPHP